MKNLTLVFLILNYFTINSEIKEYCVINTKQTKEDTIQKVEVFLKELAMRESTNTWDTVNQLGYVGKYQFGLAARRTVKVKDFTWRDFKRNPHIWPEHEQESAVIRLIKINQKYLNHYFNLDSIVTKRFYLKRKSYMYCKNENTEITWSGLYAACHLSGPGNVKKFLQSNGNYNHSDANGMTTFDYLKHFSKINIKPII